MDGESYLDYFVRLFEHKKEYGLNCIDIASLLNHENGNEYGESAYRKEWQAFNRGREYERSCSSDRDIVKILSISDLHIPFQLPIKTFSSYRHSIDILVLNGDIIDHQAISKFPKQYRNNPMDEIIQTRQYLIDLIDFIHPKKVIANYGNHEMRFNNYLAKRIDTEIKELMPDTVLDLIFTDGFWHYNKQSHTKTWYHPIDDMFDDIEIQYTQDWKCKIGKTWFAHPSSFSEGVLKTCEKAMEYFFKTDKDIFDTICLAHTHRTGDTKSGNIFLFEQGACCQTDKLDYVRLRMGTPQQQGFVLICQDKNGSLIFDKTKRIIL